MLQGRKIVLGVTGSIAAYKAADLASKLMQAGALVDVILTQGATQFITPLTFRSLTHRPVVTNLFDPESELSVEHVALAERADIVVVVPATANVIAKIANGLADDSLTCTILATKSPIIIAPAMDGNMYASKATQDNIARLKGRGYVFVGPAQGRLASGLVGMGRLVDTETLMGNIRQVLGRKGELKDTTVVVTAGGTQEPIDPVRVITNRSSGKQGYAIAEAARDRGARVVLVTAASLPDPVGVECRHVDTVASMREAVLSACAGADALIMAAAVSDYRAAQVATHKIKKEDIASEEITLHLVKNADFFLEVPEGVLRVGFAAESEDLLENAREKLVKKELDLIVANDITATDAGFGVDTNRVIIIDKTGKAEHLPLMLKSQVADQILDRVSALLKVRSPK